MIGMCGALRYAQKELGPNACVNEKINMNYSGKTCIIGLMSSNGTITEIVRGDDWDEALDILELLIYRPQGC